MFLTKISGSADAVDLEATLCESLSSIILLSKDLISPVPSVSFLGTYCDWSTLERKFFCSLMFFFHS